MTVIGIDDHVTADVPGGQNNQADSDAGQDVVLAASEIGGFKDIEQHASGYHQTHDQSHDLCVLCTAEHGTDILIALQCNRHRVDPVIKQRAV